MRSTKISGSEYTIEEIFSDKFAFTIPSYQRPYAWTTEEAEELLVDLIASLGKSGTDTDNLNPYFLGSLVLIKGDSPDAEVVDGQQRLTTLTILLSVLRELVPSIPDLKVELRDYIYQKGKVSAKTSDRYRLVIREQDSQLFREEIQKGVDKDKFLDKKVAGLSDSQKNLILNTQLLIKKLEELPETERIRLIQYITTRCYVIVVSSPDITSAYRIFSILNNRGLPLSHTDILKAQVLGKLSEISKSVEDEYRRTWEEFEDRLTRDGFANLFGHIRMIYRRSKPQDTILKEFHDHVKPTDNPMQFINNVLTPYAEAYHDLRNMDYQNEKSEKNEVEINRLFEWLNRIDNSDWIPPALYFLSEYQENPSALLDFFTALERVTAGMMILRHNVNARMERHGLIMNDVEKVIKGEMDLASLYHKDSKLQLTPDERKQILEVLSGDVYNQTRIRLYILLRIDDALSDPKPSYNYNVITVEHVLPQNPKTSSDWLKIFTDQKKREQYTNQLGNLALLSRRKNASAGNKEFVDKKLTYFTKEVSAFALTMKVLGEPQWTPTEIEKRQKEALDALKVVWNL